MTTGCTCGTPGCGGIAPMPGGTCRNCQIGITPQGTARTLRGLIHIALFGRNAAADGGIVWQQADREAGS